MAYSTDTFNGDGSTVEFTLTFDYIQRDHVEVRRVVKSSQAVTKLTVITTGTPTGDQYIWESDKKIKVGTAPASTDQLVIERDTPEDQQLVQWKDGSYIVATDLNTSDKQWLYNIQELEDEVKRLDGTIEGEAIKQVLGTLPVEVDSTDNQKPVISVDLIKKADAEKDPTNPSWDTDDKLASPAAIDRIYKQIVGDGAGFPGSGNKGKLGQIRIDDTGSTPEMFYWDTGTTAWIQVKVKGDQGIQGPPGPPPGLQSPPADASNVALKPGNVLGDATASVAADSGGDLKFTFGVPVGRTGATGPIGPTAPPVVISQDTQPTFADDVLWFNTLNGKAYFGYTDPNGDEYWVSISVPGPEGKAATVAVGKTDTGVAGSPATVTNVGSANAAIFNFVIPQGAAGANGTNGAAATIAVGTTTTLTPGSSATVANAGSSSAAVFNFGIPQGAAGADGVTAIIQETAPTTGLVDGQIWFDSVRGRSYMYWLSQTVWVQM
ncbi:MAG: hypothetical protein CMP83_10645 [Gammaproteobacteria bacterium]|nr:hypothetical protein [Gammaproteobacteria bacterium]